MDGGEYVSMAGEFNDLKTVLISLLAILHSDTLMCNYYLYITEIIITEIPVKFSFLLLGYQRAVGYDGSND